MSNASANHPVLLRPFFPKPKVCASESAREFDICCSYRTVCQQNVLLRCAATAAVLLGMASIKQEISNICRFCLNQDEQYLIPIVKMLDASLTIEDVQRFSGLKVRVPRDSARWCLHEATLASKTDPFALFCR